MGVYVYTVRAKTCSLVLPNDKKVRGHLLSYAYKDCWGAMTDKHNRIKLAKAEAVVEKYQPKYVVFGDFTEGSTVYKWNQKTFMTYDSPNIESIKAIGTLGCKTKEGYIVRMLTNG